MSSSEKPTRLSQQTLEILARGKKTPPTDKEAPDTRSVAERITDRARTGHSNVRK